MAFTTLNSSFLTKLLARTITRQRTVPGPDYYRMRDYPAPATELSAAIVQKLRRAQENAKERIRNAQKEKDHTTAVKERRLRMERFCDAECTSQSRPGSIALTETSRSLDNTSSHLRCGQNSFSPNSPMALNNRFIESRNRRERILAEQVARLRLQSDAKRHGFLVRRHALNEFDTTRREYERIAAENKLGSPSPSREVYFHPKIVQPRSDAKRRQQCVCDAQRSDAAEAMTFGRHREAKRFEVRARLSELQRYQAQLSEIRSRRFEEAKMIGHVVRCCQQLHK